MTEQNDVSIDLAIYEPDVLPDVLERVVSAMAALANLSIDRLMNALTVVDALVPGVVAEMNGETARHVGITASDGRLDVVFDRLTNGEADEIREGASIPGLGDILDKLTADVRVEKDETSSRLVVSLD